MAGRYGKYGEIKRFNRLRKSKTEKLKLGLSLLRRKYIEDHNIFKKEFHKRFDQDLKTISRKVNMALSYRISNDFKKDCPKCKGFGAYYMTNCDDEIPIQCCCDDYVGEEWEDLKEKWVLEGWTR
jgi:hypothetical protein